MIKYGSAALVIPLTAMRESRSEMQTQQSWYST